MKLLILYGSSEGQTHKIAQCIGEVIQDNNHEAVVYSLKNLPQELSLEGFDGVIIGASIHMALYQKYVVSYVKNHQQAIDKLPNAFFSVCMAAQDKSQAGQQETQQYIEQFVRKTGWTPQRSVSFAGAIRYRQYNFFIRLLMKAIAKYKRLSTDTSRNHEYTDWDQVKRFAEDFIERDLSG